MWRIGLKVMISSVFVISFIIGEEPIKPIPQSIVYDRAKALLGKKLFHDPILSKDGAVACANCHQLDSGGDDGLNYSKGIRGEEGKINTPTVFNAFYNFRLFWDGRAKNLEEQVLGSIEGPGGMGHTMKGAVAQLKKEREYRDMFAKNYPDGITSGNLVDAIAEFEKALITPDAPFDRYLRGDENALTNEAKKGYRLFKSKGCILCHNGVLVGANLYNKFSIYQESNSTHLGRYNVTKREEDKYVFKVPSLRNIALTAPYMHNGCVETLEEAVYRMIHYQLGRSMDSEEVWAIVEFLESLTGEIPDITR